jgi:hypothetical protein
MCRLFGISSDWLLLGEEGAKENAPTCCPVCQGVVTGMDNFCPHCGQRLQKNQDSYTLLLRENIYTSLDDLRTMSRTGIFPEDSPLYQPLTQEQASRLAMQVPCVLATGLSHAQLEQILEKVIYPSSYAVYHTADGEDAQTLLQKQPLPVQEFQKTKDNNMTFGATVLAVVVGIVCAVLLFSVL